MTVIKYWSQDFFFFFFFFWGRAGVGVGGTWSLGRDLLLHAHYQYKILMNTAFKVVLILGALVLI